jgi:hypothetical protein
LFQEKTAAAPVQGKQDQAWLSEMDAFLSVSHCPVSGEPQILCSEFAKIVQERRNVRLSLLFRTFCHVVYATVGFIFATSLYCLRWSWIVWLFFISKSGR